MGSPLTNEQAHYAQSEWPEAEIISPFVQNGAFKIPKQRSQVV
jgi:hypothetical protein